MKKLLFILFILPLITFGQTIVGHKINVSGTAPALRSIVIIFAGESNSGGEAPNTGLPTVDTQVFANVKIYNNYTHTFQSLHVGVNNLLLHTGLTDNSTHGWELELAIRVTAATAQFHAPVYLIKGGQGGSNIGQWGKGASPYYYDTLLSRINTALPLISGNKQIFLWWTQGLNEASTTPSNMSVWQTNTMAFFNQFRSDLSAYNIPIVVPLFTEPSMNGLVFSPYYISIASSLQNLRVCDTYGATLLNANHWDTLGLATVADLLITQTLGMITQY